MKICSKNGGYYLGTDNKASHALSTFRCNSKLDCAVVHRHNYPTTESWIYWRV